MIARRPRNNLTAACLLGACLLLAVPLGGCDNSCYSDLTCPSWVLTVTGTSTGSGGTGGAEDVCPDDPADGPVDPSCGIWVSASLGDDANPGTQTAPAKTIAAALALAQQGGTHRIFACGETYEEAVSLPSGDSLFGGSTATKAGPTRTRKRAARSSRRPCPRSRSGCFRATVAPSFGTSP